MENKIKKDHIDSSYDYIVIVGCGRLGSFLAGILSRIGKSIVIIDKSENAFRRLPDDFGGFRLEADATEIETLLEAKIDKADVVVATTNNDNTNIMIAQIAKKIYNVQKVIARLYDPSRQKVYEEFDIETICPTTLSAEAFSKIITEKNHGGKE